MLLLNMSLDNLHHTSYLYESVVVLCYVLCMLFIMVYIYVVILYIIIMIVGGIIYEKGKVSTVPLTFGLVRLLLHSPYYFSRNSL
jgi:hypothetical protein